MTQATHSAFRPELSRNLAQALLEQRGVRDAVALIGVRGFFRGMGVRGEDDLDVYDDAAFLVTPDLCRGFVFNTDPSRLEPPSVSLKAGLWRYRMGIHTPPRSSGYPALVHAGNPVWVTVYPKTLNDYHLLAQLPNVGLPMKLGSVAAYEDAVRAHGGVVTGDGIEWRMSAHINVHRGGSSSTGSKGCQTVHPSMWDEFIEDVRKTLSHHAQPGLPYLLIEVDDLGLATSAQ
jgi:hypothetical protein